MITLESINDCHGCHKETCSDCSIYCDTCKAPYCLSSANLEQHLAND